MTSKDGFSVVEPNRMMSPFSTYGRKAACWALLKRWISSMNRIMGLPKSFFCCSALAMNSLTSLIPDRTALKNSQGRSKWRASIVPRVVLPEPGGPQKMMETSRFDSMSSARSLPLPRMWSWP